MMMQMSHFETDIEAAKEAATNKNLNRQTYGTQLAMFKDKSANPMAQS